MLSNSGKICSTYGTFYDTPFLLMLVRSNSARRQGAAERNSFLKSQPRNFIDKHTMMPKQEGRRLKRTKTCHIWRPCSAVTEFTWKRWGPQWTTWERTTGVLAVNRMHVMNASLDHYWLLCSRWASGRQFEFLHIKFHEKVSIHRQLHCETANHCEAGNLVIKALGYKPEGRVFETRWGEILKFT
jgi:hypothetical protein